MPGISAIPAKSSGKGLRRGKDAQLQTNVVTNKKTRKRIDRFVFIELSLP
jgi:hypothetical protein